jgi:GTP-binding protein HflX
MRALLVGVEFPGANPQAVEASLRELCRLVETLGHQVAKCERIRARELKAATLIGQGKLEELSNWVKGEEDSPRADLVVFDQSLTPNQLRNIELATGAEVMDRSGVIIEIFNRNARSREARLQVEIAHLRYLAPRLREVGPQDRQAGGVGQKGLGETSYELDRRRIRDRIAHLERELETIQKEQALRRERRASCPRAALVGYTNAGKSSLLRALTGSDVLVENKLFATLDTTVRAVAPETSPRILISDTVGFIANLPHDLVASFRSTLDEALDASLLLHVIDASDPERNEQREVTDKVLEEIGAGKIPRLLVFNKCDVLERGPLNRLKLEHPGALFLSALSPDAGAMARNALIEHFERQMSEEEVLIPYRLGALASEIRESGRVLKEEFLEEGVKLRVRAFAPALARLRAQLAKGNA